MRPPLHEHRAVLGKSAEEGHEPTSYAVDLDDVDEGWTIDARDLVATGHFRKREDYYDGTSIRVSVYGALMDWTERAEPFSTVCRAWSLAEELQRQLGERPADDWDVVLVC